MSFKFTKDELERLDELRTKVDDDRALVLPALWILQKPLCRRFRGHPQECTGS